MLSAYLENILILSEHVQILEQNDFVHFARILSNQRNISYCVVQLISEILVKIAFPEQMSDHTIFLTLLSNENIVDEVGNYIQKALHCRRFLLSKQKQHVINTPQYAQYASHGIISNTFWYKGSIIVLYCFP